MLVVVSPILEVMVIVMLIVIDLVVFHMNKRLKFNVGFWLVDMLVIIGHVLV